MKIKDYNSKKKNLKNNKREIMKEEFNSAKERKAVINSFKKEF